MNGAGPCKLGLAAAVAVVLIGGIAVVASFGVSSPVPLQVPPWAAPFAVGMLLIGLGLTLAFQAATGRWRPDAQPTGHTVAAVGERNGSASGLSGVAKGGLPVLAGNAARAEEPKQSFVGEAAHVRLVWLGCGVLANLMLIGPLGFIPASAALFVATASAFGGRRPLAHLVLGVAMASALELVFVMLLGLDLGRGLFSLSR